MYNFPFISAATIFGRRWLGRTTNILVTTFNIFHTTRVRIGVRDAPHIWGAGEIRNVGERRLFGGLARSKPFVTPHIWGTGKMSTEISATYLGRWGNKHWKSRRIYVALGHDELIRWIELWNIISNCNFRFAASALQRDNVEERSVINYIIQMAHLNTLRPSDAYMRQLTNHYWCK